MIEITFKLLDDLRVEPWNIRGIGLGPWITDLNLTRLRVFYILDKVFDLKPANNYAKDISAMWATRNERRKNLIAEEKKKVKSDSEESLFSQSDSRNSFRNIQFFNSFCTEKRKLNLVTQVKLFMKMKIKAWKGFSVLYRH